MIRQAISCDICGTEMLHTNHWFVASEQGVDLRVSVWNSRSRLRAGAKHLCGQTCLHKLVDEFMARAISARMHPAARKAAADAELPCIVPARADSSLAVPAVRAVSIRPQAQASGACVDEYESSARLITVPEPSGEAEPGLAQQPPNFSSRNWHAEAWRREREREQRAENRRSARRRSIA